MNAAHVLTLKIGQKVFLVNVDARTTVSLFGTIVGRRKGGRLRCRLENGTGHFTIDSAGYARPYGVVHYLVHACDAAPWNTGHYETAITFANNCLF